MSAFLEGTWIHRVQFFVRLNKHLVVNQQNFAVLHQLLQIIGTVICLGKGLNLLISSTNAHRQMEVP